jgi:hypothetical protein
MSTRSLLQPQQKADCAFAVSGVGLWAVTSYFTKSAFVEDTEQRDIEVFLCRPPAFEKVLLAERKQGGVLGESGYRNDHIPTFRMIS